MKFHVVRSVNTSFTSYPHQKTDTIIYFSEAVPAKVTPVEGDPWGMEKCALLKQLVEKRNSYRLGLERFWSLMVRLKVVEVSKADNLQGLKGCLTVNRIHPGDCLNKLIELFENQVKVTVDLSLSVRERGQYEGQVGKVSTKEVTPARNDKTLFEDNGLVFPRLHFGNDAYVDAWVTVTVTIPDNILGRRLLEDGAFSDVTITCSDGTEIKAHRSFLASRSSVFSAMFAEDIRESRESSLEILDMETKSVQALFLYLYYDYKKDMEGDFQVAFDLFQVGVKYEIKCLEKKMREMILYKPNRWFNVEAAAKLFMFSRNLTPVDGELKMKAVKLLELYSEALEDSPIIQELFRTDLKAGLELLKLAFKCK